MSAEKQHFEKLEEYNAEAWQELSAKLSDSREINCRLKEELGHAKLAFAQSRDSMADSASKAEKSLEELQREQHSTQHLRFEYLELRVDEESAVQQHRDAEATQQEVQSPLFP